MQSISNVAAPVGNSSRLERVYDRLPFLRRLVRLEDAVLFCELSVDIVCQPWQGIENFMSRIRRIGSPQLQESFVQWIREKRETLTEKITSGFRGLRVAEVPGDSDDDSDDEETHDGFSFIDTNYEDLSHVIMLIRWIREELELFQSLENGPSKQSDKVWPLLNLARSECRVSARELTNTFAETPEDIAEFLQLLLCGFDYNSRMGFATTRVRTFYCNEDCPFNRFNMKEDGEITQCGVISVELDLQTYIHYHLESVVMQENPCTNCKHDVAIRMQTFLNKYYVLKLPPSTGETVTIGDGEEYLLAEERYRISLLIQEEDGLYTGWIRQRDNSYNYHHREITTTNCPLPEDLTNIVLIIFVKSP